MAANQLSPADLTEIWEGGRLPLDRDLLVRRYGDRAATLVLGEDPEPAYDWFRGPLPMGITRVASGLTAFALRHERVNDGEPTILLNGHVPGLAALFRPTAWVFDLGIGAKGVDIGEVRRHLTGGDSRPDKCEPGTLRRDAYNGKLPIDGDTPVNSRHNIVHCSDGLLAGLIEVRRLVPYQTLTADWLSTRLLSAGLTLPEIDDIVLANPIITVGSSDQSLCALTMGMRAADCLAEILRVVPPVFGPANGYADGIGPEVLERMVRSVASAAGAFQNQADSEAPQSDTPLTPFTAVIRIGQAAEAAGRAALAAGRVGLLVPAGGTGGRFGGYDLPESDPRRQKALYPVFELDGRRLSSLDIRLANGRYWADGHPGAVPFAVMGSPTNVRAVHQWQNTLTDPYGKSVTVFQQHGAYRLDESLVLADPSGRWIDMVLRDPDGRPLLKPPGSFGLASCFALSGVFEAWESQGVEYVALANGDDAGFRLDPRIVGHLAQNPHINAVIGAVPWGYTATVERSGSSSELRGDESGWSIDEEGAVTHSTPPPNARLDAGGALLADSRGALVIEETRTRPAGALFNTNQIYLRLSALRAIVEENDSSDLPECVRRMRERLPLGMETKEIAVGDVSRRVWQVAQPLHGVLGLLGQCDVVRTNRLPTPDSRGAYAPLKVPQDVRFAQLALESMQAHGDELSFTG